MSNLTEDEVRVAVMKADLYLKTRQSWWETPKAIAMILLATAAIFAAGGLSTWLWPAKPQTIIVQFQQPLAVKVLPP
jgi:hypothetical protein